MSGDPLKEGDTVNIQVMARVLAVSDAHGYCIKVDLGQRDFKEPRVIWLDPDEYTTPPNAQPKRV